MSEAVLDTTEVRRWRRHHEYRASGAIWHWEVPTHWDVRRMKYLATMNPSKSEIASIPRDTDVSFLPMEKVGEDGSLTLDSKKTIEAVFQGFTYFRDNDVLVAKITPCFENGKGALAVGLENGIGFGTTEFHVLRSRGEIEPKYLELVTRLHAFRGQGISEFTGAAGQQRIPESFLNDYAAPLPPLAEQRAIAAFLDRETARIDALVGRKKRLIELLEEKRQAVISQAVTKGLDPNVEMKDSGLEWLGLIPSHWSVKRLKHISPEQSVGLVINPSTYVDPAGTVPFILGTNILPGRIRMDGIRRITEESNEKISKSKLRAGDIVTVRVGAPGVSAVVPPELDNANCASVMITRGAPSRFNSDWLCYALNSCVGMSNVALTIYGAAQEQFNVAHGVNFQIPVPPRDEQDQIVATLDKHGSSARLTLETVKDSITKLKEYRTALISAAVTGQIDVRDEVQIDN